MEKHEHIAQLIFKHLSNSLNDQECRMLQEWVASSERNSKLFNRLTSESYWEQTGAIDLNERLQEVKKRNAATPINCERTN